VFEKGTSKRIWGELYKVVDASDVLIEVLDARDPMGTRCRHIEQQLKEVNFTEISRNSRSIETPQTPDSVAEQM
jgi:ribosome biogenesis GTPase A